MATDTAARGQVHRHARIRTPVIGRVTADPAVKGIRTRTADQRIIARPAVQRIGPVPASQRIIAGTAIQRIVAVHAIQRVAADTAVQCVIAVIARRYGQCHPRFFLAAAVPGKRGHYCTGRTGRQWRLYT